MANPLPVVIVAALADVGRIPTYAGPHRIVLRRAESLSDARAMLTVLRAKGVLQVPHAVAEGFDDFALHAADAEAQEGGGSGSDSDVDEQVEGSDLLLLLSDASSDDHDGGANGAAADDVAAGWVVENIAPFRRAISLDLILEEVSSDILPRLVDNPADVATLHRLRLHAREIRRVGRELPALMGQPPVTLGNFLKRAVAGALSRGSGGGGAAWMASKLDSAVARVMDLYEQRTVELALADPEA